MKIDLFLCEDPLRNGSGSVSLRSERGSARLLGGPVHLEAAHLAKGVEVFIRRSMAFYEDIF